MDIFRAVKKEKSSLKRFYIIMSILIILLPLTLYLTGIYTTFYIMYLVLVEILIIIAILNKINTTRIKYSCINNKLKFSCGLSNKENLIVCDKVVLVHTEKMEDNIEIYLFTTASYKNKSLKVVGKNALKKIPNIQKEYNKIKENNHGSLIYYQVIKKGGLRKYLLLDIIYKNCVKATYTEQCIENIKIARGQTLV